MSFVTHDETPGGQAGAPLRPDLATESSPRPPRVRRTALMWRGSFDPKVA